MLTKITKTSISYYDSLNISLRDIWNGTEESITEQEKNHKDYKDLKIRQHNLKEALQILLDLLAQKKTAETILVEKRIEDIVGSFNLIKDNQAEF